MQGKHYQISSLCWSRTRHSVVVCPETCASLHADYLWVWHLVFYPSFLAEAVTSLLFSLDEEELEHLRNFCAFLRQQAWWLRG